MRIVFLIIACMFICASSAHAEDNPPQDLDSFSQAKLKADEFSDVFVTLPKKQQEAIREYLSGEVASKQKLYSSSHPVKHSFASKALSALAISGAALSQGAASASAYNQRNGSQQIHVTGANGATTNYSAQTFGNITNIQQH